MGWLGLDILMALSSGVATTQDLATAIGANAGTVRCTCGVLRKKGLVASVCKNSVHEITDAGKSALASGHKITSGPVRGSVRQPNSLRARAWSAMRIKRKFSVPILCSMLCDGSATDPEGNLRQYILPLLRAGYLVALPGERDGTPRYLLVKDTGPLAPSWNKEQRCLADPNTGEQIIVEGKHGRLENVAGAGSAS